MMLQNKNAVVYGAGGSLGGTVAKALAGSGARVFLTGRNISSVQKIADEIRASGGSAQVNQVDALDEKAINMHLDNVLDQAGTVDISFNATGTEVVQNISLVTMSANDFIHPITFMMQTQ